MNEDLEFQLSNLAGTIWVLCGIAFLFVHPLIGFGLIALWLAGCIIAGVAKVFSGPVSKLGRAVAGAVRGYQQSRDAREVAK